MGFFQFFFKIFRTNPLHIAHLINQKDLSFYKVLQKKRWLSLKNNFIPLPPPLFLRIEYQSSCPQKTKLTCSSEFSKNCQFSLNNLIEIFAKKLFSRCENPYIVYKYFIYIIIIFKILSTYNYNHSSKKHYIVAI